MNVPLVTKFTSVRYLLWSPECARSVFLCRHFVCCLYYCSEWDRYIMCIVVLWRTEQLLNVYSTTALDRTVALFLFMNVMNGILLLCTAAIYLTHSSTDANGWYILVMLKKLQYDERITVCSRQLLQPGVIFWWILIFTKFWLFLRLWNFSNCLIRVCSVSYSVAQHCWKCFFRACCGPWNRSEKIAEWPRQQLLQRSVLVRPLGRRNTNKK